MRPLLFLAPLGMLMLSSCEPAGGSSNAGNNRSSEHGDGWSAGIASDSAGNSQLAAQDSVGRTPPPRHLADGVDNVCPVHHETMRIREIPIVFMDTEGDGSGPGTVSGTAQFPFGAEKILSAGNALLPGVALTARVYQCGSCVSARRAAEARHAHAAPPEGSQ